MKHHFSIPIIFSILLMAGCADSNVKNDFSGFWEGPHPEDVNKKFYIQITSRHDSVSAHGFWTQNNFYDSEFLVGNLSLYADSIRFTIPSWHCTYAGKMYDNHLIKGGFDCQGEPFDSVSLVKHNEVKRILTEAKPGCSDVNYTYRYETPASDDDLVPSAHFHSTDDSLFIYSLVREIINNRYGRINSFLLVKDGQLICEEYFYGYTKNDLHQIESSTKSITSLLIGIAKDKGMLPDINEPIYRIFSSDQHLQDEGYNQITVAHLLTMTSGFSNEYEPYQDYDRIAHALHRKLVEMPGEKFIYDGGNTEILGGVIKAKTGLYADVFAANYLFQPLEISNYNWSIFKQDHYPCMGGSLHLLPRDMAKIGTLVLNHGEFNNKQIISADWIKESTTPKVKTHIENDAYAYLWWNITISSDSTDYEVIWANGNGSQFIYIVPELNVVIVTTGYNYAYDSWAITDGIGKYLYLLDDR